ncbi:hypothetical protein [Streptomyces nigra]|uniref:hypothetical protein n=1 Tax=Streptomyces nigra TaxID=1827580 RepID=UPI0030CD2973
MSVGFRPTEDDTEIIEALKRPGEKTSDVLRRALRALEREEWQRQALTDMERIAASGENLAEEPDEWEHDETGQPVDRRTEEHRPVDVVAEVAAEFGLIHAGDPEQKQGPSSRLGQRRLLAAALAASQRRNSSSPLYLGRAARHAADAVARRLDMSGRLDFCLDHPGMWPTGWQAPRLTRALASRLREQDRVARMNLVWAAVNQNDLTERQEKILDELAESLRGDEVADK